MSEKYPQTLVLSNPGLQNPGFFICWHIWVRGGSLSLIASYTYFLGFLQHLEKLAMNIPYLL